MAVIARRKGRGREGFNRMRTASVILSPQGARVKGGDERFRGNAGEWSAGEKPSLNKARGEIEGEWPTGRRDSPRCGVSTPRTGRGSYPVELTSSGTQLTPGIGILRNRRGNLMDLPLRKMFNAKGGAGGEFLLSLVQKI